MPRTRLGLTGTSRLAMIVALASLGGCSGSRLNIDAETPAQLQSEPVSVLCDTVSQNTPAKEKFLAELLRRGAVRNEHAGQIGHGKIVVGMNSCEAMAAWGPPKSFSSTPVIDYPSDRSVEGVAMVYDYGPRGRIYFDADRIVTEIVP